MLLSVRLMIYNHSEYIVAALDSINMQQTTFPFEVVIGDDFSSDDTLAKVMSYEFTNPDVHVNVLERQRGGAYDVKRQQLGRLYNFADIIQHCRGRYIALLDGDDYWTDPLKLQKQVDVLEQHPQLNVCFSNRRVLSEGVLSSPPMPKDFVEVPFSYKELLKHHNFIVTASVVFRKPERFVFPDWFYQLPYGDMGLYKLLSTQDDFYGIADSTVVYRVHGSGIYSGVGKLTSRKLYYRFYKIIYPYLTREEQIVSKQKMLELTAEIGRLRFKGQPFKQRLYRIGFKMGLIT